MKFLHVIKCFTVFDFVKLLWLELCQMATVNEVSNVSLGPLVQLGSDTFLYHQI